MCVKYTRYRLVRGASEAGSATYIMYGRSYLPLSVCLLGHTTSGVWLSQSPLISRFTLKQYYPPGWLNFHSNDRFSLLSLLWIFHFLLLLLRRSVRIPGKFTERLFRENNQLGMLKVLFCLGLHEKPPLLLG